MSDHVFVFGSNRAGRHGAGSDRAAVLQHGAIYGQGEGLQGRSYGIPTKDHALRVLPLSDVQTSVETFLAFARTHSELTFDVCAIGCGLAGFTPEQIAPLFRSAPVNCHLPEQFRRVLFAASVENKESGIASR